MFRTLPLLLSTLLLLTLPLAADEHHLTLDEALAMALAANPAITEATWQLDESIANRELASSARRPSLTAHAAYDHYTADQRLAQPTSATSKPLFGAGIASADLVLGIPLYTGGGITANIAATDALHAAALGRLSRTREMVAFNVTSLYYTLLAQREVIRSVAFSLNAMEEQRRTIAEQVAAAKVAHVDLLRADVRLATLRENLTREENHRLLQQRTLAALLGWQHPFPPDVIGELPATNAIPILEIDHCIADAFAQRADYAALQQEVTALQQLTWQARAQRRPSLSLQASYGLRWMPDPTDSRNGADDTFDVGRIGIAAAWPFIDGGATIARTRAGHARLNAARARLHALALQIRHDVETAHADMSAAHERVATATAAIEQARETFRIMREKQELGKGTLTDVLDAQAELMITETLAVRATSDLILAHARGLLAKGGLLP